SGLARSFAHGGRLKTTTSLSGSVQESIALRDTRSRAIPERQNEAFVRKKGEIRVPPGRRGRGSAARRDELDRISVVHLEDRVRPARVSDHHQPAPDPDRLGDGALLQLVAPAHLAGVRVDADRLTIPVRRDEDPVRTRAGHRGDPKDVFLPKDATIL